MKVYELIAQLEELPQYAEVLHINYGHTFDDKPEFSVPNVFLNMNGNVSIGVSEMGDFDKQRYIRNLSRCTKSSR